MNVRMFAAVDIETDGLDPDRNHILEVGIVREVPDGGLEEYEFALPFEPDEFTSDVALRVNGWGEREFPQMVPFNQAAMIIQNALNDRHLVGKNPQFDAAFLARLVRDFGGEPSWHHRLVDVGMLAWASSVTTERWAGMPFWPQPPNYMRAMEMVGVEYDESKLHGALYDARLAYQVFRKVVTR